MGNEATVRVPRAAAELLDSAVATRQQRDDARALLREHARAQGDGSMADMIAVLRHRLALVEGRYQTAEAALRALEKHWPEAAPQVDAWKQATNQHVRST